MIKLKKVSKFYSNRNTVSTGFSKIDLELHMGEFVAVTGESGSGKSTLINVISGLDSYEEGEMFVNDESTSGYTTEDYENYRKTYIGNIFQDFNLVNSYTVYQNIELSMLLCGTSKKDCIDRINELIAQVNLEDYAKVKVSKLSGGQKQRVAIARAFAKDSPIIIADEPTGNLDSESAVKVMKTLHDISKDKLVIVVTHNFEQVEPYITRKITMHDGKIIEDKILKEPNITVALPLTDAVETSSVISESETKKSESEKAVSEDVLSMKTTDVNSKKENAEADVEDLSDVINEPYDPLKIKPSRVSRSERLHADTETEKSKTPIKVSLPHKNKRDKPKKRENENKKEEKVKGDLYAAEQFGKFSTSSQIRLGVRNTFNIPTKFILLLVIYIFVTSAVLAQYSSFKSTNHQTDLLGSNSYFIDTSAKRIILHKDDNTVFNSNDYETVKSTTNIDYIVKNDISLDVPITLANDSIDISGPAADLDTFKESDLTYGTMPANDHEIIISVNKNGWSEADIKDNQKKIIGTEYYVDSTTSGSKNILPYALKVTGIAIVNEPTTSLASMQYSQLYVSPSVSQDIITNYLASSANTTIDYNGKKVELSNMQVVYPSSSVPAGKAYISEDQKSYYTNGNAVGKPISVSIESVYYEDALSLTVDKVYTEDTIKNTLGFEKDDYTNYTSAVFVNTEDFNTLFEKGNYQISAYMDEETDSAATKAALIDEGYKPLFIKDTLSSGTGGFDFVITLISAINMIVVFIGLFFIAYAVIRLIEKSRNSYYSTLRILGATKGNAESLLKIELLSVMVLSYILVIAGVILVKQGIIINTTISNLLLFLTFPDYLLLFAALILMSLMIANRYSRKLFEKSAMNTYREEA